MAAIFFFYSRDVACRPLFFCAQSRGGTFNEGAAPRGGWLVLFWFGQINGVGENKCRCCGLHQNTSGWSAEENSCTVLLSTRHPPTPCKLIDFFFFLPFLWACCLAAGFWRRWRS